MPSFKAEVHQIRFRLGLPQAPLGEATALPRTPSWIWGASKRREGKGETVIKGRGRGQKGEKGEGKEQREGRGKGWEGLREEEDVFSRDFQLF